MTNIEYYAFENDAILAHVKALFEEYRPLLPDWLNTLTVVSSAQDGEGNCLKVHYSQHEYMHARISVFPVYFDQTEKQQRIGIIHEMVHIQDAARLDFTESHLIKPIKERNPELHGYIWEEFRVKLERFTESTAIGIYRAMGAAKAKGANTVFGPSVSVRVCAKCGGGQGIDLRAGSKPGIWFCGPCWDSLYQHGNGAQTSAAESHEAKRNPE